jgi:hypothetical protein
MMRLDDGRPADPAMKNDWEHAVQHVLELSRQQLRRAEVDQLKSTLNDKQKR